MKKTFHSIRWSLAMMMETRMMKNKTTVRSVKMKTKSKNFVINYLRTNEYTIDCKY